MPTGAPRATLDRIYQTLNTTPEGFTVHPKLARQFEGTGLGLYIARELCECNQVRLEFLPNSETGSCFRISFPDSRKRELMT